MGKKRRPNRKPNYEDIGDIQDRMAGDAITDDDVTEALGKTILAELRGDVAIDAAMQDAMEYLPRRRAELAAMGATSDEIMKLGELSGYGQANVPAALERDTHRVHTEYDINPVTGEQEVIPFIDPSVPNRVLKTAIGDVRADVMQDRAGHDRASEYLGEKVLKLMGRRGRANNKNPQLDYQGNQRYDKYGKPMFKHWQADLIDETNNRNIDVEANFTTGFSADDLKPQIYTGITPGPDLGNQSVRQVIERHMRANNVSPIEAVESLIHGDKQKLAYPRGNITLAKGKVLKNDASFTPNREDQYDDILFVGMPSDRAKAMGARDNDVNLYNRSSNYLVNLPNELRMADLEKVRAYIDEQGSALVPRLVINENTGNNKDRAMAHQIQANIPKDALVGGVPVATDVTRTHPLTQQLLARQPLM